MNVPTGYKRTEIGVIPKEWGIKRLGEVAVVKDGTHQTPRYVPVGVPFYSVEHVTSGDFHNTKFISEQEHRLLTRYFRIEKDDILMTRIGSIGDCKLIDWDVDASFYVSLALLKIREADPAFITQYSKSSAFKTEVELRSLGSAIPKKINLGPISDIRIALPPLPEQRAIAQALGDVDALLGALDAAIIKQRDLKQAAMQKLLKDQTRLPGFQGAWEIKRLGDVAHIKTGNRNNEDKVDDGRYPFYVRSDTVERINSYSHECEAVLVPGEGRIGEIFHYINGRFDVHQRVYAITQFHKEVSGKYVHLYMTMFFGIHAMQNTVKATVDSLRLPTFQVFEMNLPPTRAEQDAIVAIVSDIDAGLANLESRRAKTAVLKQAMMQDILTGKRRLI